jgi:PAS domain S-box-containing protein
MRIDIPPSLLHGVDLTRLKGRTPVINKRTDVRFVRRDSSAPKTHYSQLLKSLYDAAIITDTTGNIVDANSRATEFLQYDLAELKKMHIHALISGAEANLMATIKEILHSDRYLLIQAFCLRRDETIFPAEISINILELDELRYCLFIRDVTVRRQSEEMLRTGYNAISNASNGIAVADLQGTLVYVNPAAAKLWSYLQPSDMIGNNVRDLWISPEYADPFLESVTKKQENWNGEIMAVTRKGEAIHVQVSAACNRDAEDQLIGMVLSFADVSDRKNAEEAHRKAEAQQAMLASLATACHHIGQPATVIMGSLGLLKEILKRQGDPEVQHILDDSLHAAEQLAQVLHKFNRLTVYRTVNYLESAENKDSPENKLLDLEFVE